MKKTFFLSLFLLTFIRVDIFAQAPHNRENSRPENADQHPMADAATRTQKFTDHLTKMLNLDAATAKNVYNAYLARTKKVDEIQASAVSGKEKNDALKANKDAFEISLKGILSAEQYAQFTKMEADRKAEQKGHRGNDNKPSN